MIGMKLSECECVCVCVKAKQLEGKPKARLASRNKCRVFFLPPTLKIYSDAPQRAVESSFNKAGL